MRKKKTIVIMIKHMIHKIAISTKMVLAINTEFATNAEFTCNGKFGKAVKFPIGLDP